MTIYFSLSSTTQSEIAVPLNEKYLAPKKEAKKAQRSKESALYNFYNNIEK